jgi:BirA family transcriptional regulator, biotin operon repressor / biotin---[acetyl-CoA-carboxylase] ligase
VAILHSIDDIALPPLYRLHAIRTGDAFAEACAIAPSDGAGTLVWARRGDVLDCAVVLEPDMPLQQTRLVAYVGLSALADALGALGPPHKPVTFVWPDTLLVDGGTVGGIRFAHAPVGTEADADVPDWAVVGATVRMTAQGETTDKDRTALYEEGFGEVEVPQLLEAFARHFMARLSDWAEEGFLRQSEEWMGRLAPTPGPKRALDPGGDLVVFAGGRPERRSLAEALAAGRAAPGWGTDA